MATKLTDRASISKILFEMTVDEKVLLLTGGSAFRSFPLEKYGIPSILYVDSGAGVNIIELFIDCFYGINNSIPRDVIMQDCGSDQKSFNFNETRPRTGEFNRFLRALYDSSYEEGETAEFLKELEFYRREMEAYVPEGVLPSCFPAGMMLAATWNPESVYQCARALGKEANHYHVDVMLGTPNINIQRDPLAGRLFETYSEDPFLISALAPEFVNGIQDEGVIADVKHFAANNQETERRKINECITERAMREIYFPGFKACVQQGKCKTVMSAYNAINGEFCAHNYWLLEDVLRKEWGFDGVVVSDWGAVNDQVASLKSGNDVDMPGPRALGYVINAVKSGELSEEKLNQSVERFLKMLLDSPAMKGRKSENLDRAYSWKAAYGAAREGVVLLKNESATLPLSRKAKVSFYGAYSRRMIESGGGSGNVITDQHSGILDCCAQMLGAENVCFEETDADTDAVVVVIGVVGQEGFDRADLSIGEENAKSVREGIAAAKRLGKKPIVVLNVCGPVDVESFVDDASAILCAFIPGMAGGKAVADALFGEFNPSGKLPITFPKRYCDCPSSGNFPGRGGKVYYAEGIFVGYRHYDYRNVEPRFAFGHGLSYTQFEISNVRLSSNELDIDCEDEIIVSGEIKNIGSCAGKEVVQLYIGQCKPSLVKPIKELKGFEKIELEKDESKSFSFRIGRDMLRSFDDEFNDWVVETGKYNVYIATSSRDVHAMLNFEAKGYNPCGFGPNTCLDRIIATPGALETILKFCPEESIDRKTVELGVMFAAALPIREYWKRNIAPNLKGISEEERDRLYRDMLTAINKFK